MQTNRRNGARPKNQRSDEVVAALLPRRWVLVPSYQLGPETWRGVADVLSMLGQEAIIPTAVRTTPRDDDHITPWLDGIVSQLPEPTLKSVVVVGHSASCPRLPMVIDRLINVGHRLDTMVLVNGRFPEDGVAPTDRDFPMRDVLDNIVRPDDYLPPWHRWWGPMIPDMLPDDEVRQRVLSEAMPVPRALFDQPIPAPELPRSMGRAFLALGDMYQPSYDQAVEAGWIVDRLEGEHLHMVVDPVMVAGALISLVARASACDDSDQLSD